MLARRVQRVGALVWLVSLVAAAACDGETSVRWVIELPSATDLERAATLDVWIDRGTCGSNDRIFETSFPIGEADAAPRPEPLGDGHYAISARAVDLACLEFARGCVEVELPLDAGEVVVPLEAVAATATCPASQCAAGACADCEPATAVGAGDLHTCAIGTDGRLWCWGANTSGQLGIPDRSDTFAPVPVGDATDWRQVVGGSGHTCGIRDDGGARSLWCWGTGLLGQLGLDGVTEAREPTRLALDGWQSVTAGSEHTCGIRGDGELYCWGEGALGRLGFGDETDVATPTRVGTERWRHVDAGSRHTCAVHDDQSVWCWGDNGCRQAGTGDVYAGEAELSCGPETSVLAPARVDASSSWALVAAGENFSCGARTDGTVGCWGNDGRGQRGDAANIGCCRPDPGSVSDTGGWIGPAVELSASRYHACAIDGASELFCWGHGPRGQLGIGGDTGATLYIRVPTSIGAPFTSVATGSLHTCAVTGDSGSVLCTGDNAQGQRGVTGPDPVTTMVATCLR